jgi:hypothetical protein
VAEHLLWGGRLRLAEGQPLLVGSVEVRLRVDGRPLGGWLPWGRRARATNTIPVDKSHQQKSEEGAGEGDNGVPAEWNSWNSQHTTFHKNTFLLWGVC